MKYILTIDQGTSGTKALLFDQNGQFVARENMSHRQYYPNPGWVEHDAEEIYSNTLTAIERIIKNNDIDITDILVLSLTNQRETVVAWDKNTGKPVCNAIVWQCNRATEICEKLSDCADMVKKKTGLVLSPYYSAAKIKWILDNIPEARQKADSGDLYVGTIDSWLIYNFTGKKAHMTDCSNASRTQLMNIKELCWDKQILDIFNIPLSVLPQIKSSDYIFGTVKDGILSGYNIPISGVLGDSHAALFGQNCFKRGETKVTYGTGSSIMMNIGEAPYSSQKGLVTSIGWGMGDNIVYVAEGNINCSAATIKWLVNDIELIKDSKCTEEISLSVDDSGGVYLVPAFVGLGTPYWDSEATGLITGLTRGTKKAHIVRAACESICYQVKDVIDIMASESDVKVEKILVDGGASRNKFIMQFQADMLDADVVVNEVEEICALGSAYMAGIAIKLFRQEELHKLRKNDNVFSSAINQDKRNQLYKGWKSAIKRTMFKS